MAWVTLVIVLALLEFVYFGALVGRARHQYDVPAPAHTGHPMFERYNRVHQNTMEQLVVFIPALWLFAQYLNPIVGALLGLVFIASRATVRSELREGAEVAAGRHHEYGTSAAGAAGRRGFRGGESLLA